MKTQEKITEKIRKFKRSNKLMRIFGFFSFTLIFGILFFMQQVVSFNVVDKRPDNYVREYTSSSDVNYWVSSNSEKFAVWIHEKYTYLGSVSETLSLIILLGSSLLAGMILSYIMVPIYGTTGWWYFDEFKIKFTVNGNEVTVNGKKSENMIKGLRIISKVEDLGDKYKFRACTYDLMRGVRGTEEFIVEKWKVLNKSNKWWF